MRKFELKRIVEILWRNPTSEEEKTPIASKNNVSYNKSEVPMDRNLSSSDIFRNTGKGLKDDSIESRKEETPEKMSELRKFCLFLSLNTGLMYFVVLAWLLPCRDSSCSLPEEHRWTMNLSNIQLTTNLETQNNLSLFLFGYSEKDNDVMMGAWRISDGEQMWNYSLPSVPAHVFCHANNRDIRINGRYCCLVTSASFVAAIAAGNGNIIWERNITSDHQKISKVALTQENGHKPYLMGVSDNYLHLIDAENGTEVSMVSLPCTWTVDVKIAGPWLTRKGYMWSIVCEYEDGMEAFTFKEMELLNSSENRGNGTNSVNDIKFKPLLNQQSYSGSIDLAGDVTTTSYSLVLSWADMVTMVTAQAPSHHLQKTWERHFSDLHEYDVDVTGAVAGHFKDSKSMEIAVAVVDNTNSTIYVLETLNGTSIDEVEISFKSVTSIKKIPGKNNAKDIIFIETVPSRNPSNRNVKIGVTTRSYFTLHYEDGKSVLQNVTTVEDVYDSSLSITSEENAHLLLASTTTDRNTIMNQLTVSHTNVKKNFCKIEYHNHKNTSTIMYLE